MSLFEEPDAANAVNTAGTPLAERMRPRTLDDVVGQGEVLGPETPLRKAIERDLLPRMKSREIDNADGMAIAIGDEGISQKALRLGPGTGDRGSGGRGTE